MSKPDKNKEVVAETPSTETIETEQVAAMENEGGTPASEPVAPIVRPVVTREAFDAALLKFRGATRASMAAARQCAEMSLVQFADHGDLQYVYDFISAIDTDGKNYVRKNAYILWLAAFAPVTWDKDKKKLVKDKSENATAFDVDKALAKPFWDFKPESPAELFAALDLVTALRRLVNQRRNANKWQAADDLAVEGLKAIDELAVSLEKRVKTANSAG